MRTIEGDKRETFWRGPRLRADGESIGGCSVLRLAGDLDSTSAPPLRDWMIEGVDDGRVGQRIVLDLGDVELFDSSGLGAIVTVWKRTRTVGGDLGVARPPRVCGIMMRRTGLAGHIVMADAVPAVTELLVSGAMACAHVGDGPAPTC
ncbi:STAS domain-containing protein [Nonomuraea sp. MG754425]|uniref:STAS domain-containing protein n=1 Tax=Nonomuraea sp. MG754425 TaxID=2570319 RepID=UPI001F408253|nr:STAS domain-containing protein [Nonomuraea sp. MG754425]MCF6474444.1 STAS domain-containing protein [Nonomuraea sp. MG754425]